MCNVLMRKDTMGGFVRVTCLLRSQIRWRRNQRTFCAWNKSSEYPSPVLAGWLTLFTQTPTPHCCGSLTTSDDGIKAERKWPPPCRFCTSYAECKAEWSHRIPALKGQWKSASCLYSCRHYARTLCVSLSLRLCIRGGVRVCDRVRSKVIKKSILD